MISCKKVTINGLDGVWNIVDKYSTDNSTKIIEANQTITKYHKRRNI